MKTFLIVFCFMSFLSFLNSMTFAQTSTTYRSSSLQTSSNAMARSGQPAKNRLSKVPGTKFAELTDAELAESSATVQRNPAQFVMDRELMEKAKSHQYRGGAEEGELRVQAQLAKSQRKIAPAVDKNAMEKEAQDHD